MTTTVKNKLSGYLSSALKHIPLSCSVRKKAMETTVPDWSSLPRDLLVSIAKLIVFDSVKDFMAFRATCASWNDAGGDDECFRACVKWPRVPFLMSPDKGEFYSLAREKMFKMRIPLPEESKYCKFMESRFGWVLTLAISGQAELLYPFSGARIQLPNYQTLPQFESRDFDFITRPVLSDNPSQTSDYVLVVLTRICMAFWRPSDRNWTKIETEGLGHDVFADLIFSSKDRKFYALTHNDQIWVWDMVREYAFLGLPLPQPLRKIHIVRRYLVEESSTGGLVMVTLSISFQVHRLNVIKRCWEPTYSLKDVIFVGNNASFSLLPDGGDKVIRSNCIYFTSNVIHQPGGLSFGNFDDDLSHDMGIYSLEDGSIQRFPPPLRRASYFTSPPLWIAPSTFACMFPARTVLAKVDVNSTVSMSPA